LFLFPDLPAPRPRSGNHGVEKGAHVTLAAEASAARSSQAVYRPFFCLSDNALLSCYAGGVDTINPLISRSAWSLAPFGDA